MKKLLLAFSLVSLLGCSQNNSNPAFNKKYSAESAQEFIKMAREMQNGTVPDEAAWEALFATEGYHQFFMERWDSLNWQNWIRNAFAIVFNESNRNELDSILAIPITLDVDMDQIFIKNFHILKGRIDTIDHFLQSTDFEEIFERADSRSKEFLPESFSDLKPVFNDFYFVSFDMESRVMNDKIFIDINSFYEEGEQGMINLIAHELHHSYLGALMDTKYNEFGDPLFRTLSNLHSEGLADMINKQEMPVQSLGLYGKDFVDLYNAYYYSTPDLLKQMDEVTVAYINGSADDSGYAGVGKGIDFHTNGSYMVFLIRDQLGFQTAVNTCGNISHFVRCYNEAAAKSGSYVFSDTFTAYVDKICKEAEK